MEVSAKKAPSPPHIPIEIIGCILLKLKVKAFIRSQSVCKEWRSLIQNPHFKLSYRGRRRVLVVESGGSLAVTSITNHLRIKKLFRGSDDNNPFFLDTFPRLHRRWSGVWCTCNGLVLFSVGKHILLWNPFTRCCAKVLELQRLNEAYQPNDVVSGLCYVPSTGDYKAVLLLRREQRTVMVASLKNKEWRKVPFPYPTDSVREGGGVNFHDTLHWKVVCSSGWFSSLKKIIYFEAESDEFKELPTPEGKESSVILGLGIMEDCLCMACLREETDEIEVLVMKEYGVKKSWISQFVVSTNEFKCDYHTITLYSLKCNTKVMMWSCCFGSWETLVYDLKNNTLNSSLGESVRNGVPVGICSYVQSFVSPHEFIWRDNSHKLLENDVVLRFILERFNN